VPSPLKFYDDPDILQQPLPVGQPGLLLTRSAVSTRLDSGPQEAVAQPLLAVHDHRDLLERAFR
jgi:hypothetical protein